MAGGGGGGESPGTPRDGLHLADRKARLWLQDRDAPQFPRWHGPVRQPASVSVNHAPDSVLYIFVFPFLIRPLYIAF